MNRKSCFLRSLPTYVVALATLAGASNASAALFSVRAVTSDGDSGINAAKVYTHAIDLNRGGSDPTGGNDALPLTINGVPFTGITSSAGGVDANFGGVYTSTGINATFDNRATAVANGGVRDLLDDFFHNGNGTGGATPGTEVITLTGLTPGQTYKTTFFTESSFGDNLQDITVNNNGTLRSVPRSGVPGAPGAAIELTATATAAGLITYTFDAQSNGDSMHQYGFTNEVVSNSTKQLQFANVNGVIQNTAFAVATDDLLTGLVATVSGSVAREEGITTTNVGVLTNGTFGPSNAPAVPESESEIVAVHNGTVLTYLLDLTGTPQGFDIDGINTYVGWNDDGRDNQNYAVLLSFIDDPTAFFVLQNVAFMPPDSGDPSDTAVFLTSPNGDPLGVNVAGIRFVFNGVENGYVGLREIDAIGSASAIPEPATALLGLIGGLAMLRRRRMA